MALPNGVLYGFIGSEGLRNKVSMHRKGFFHTGLPKRQGMTEWLGDLRK